MSDTPTFVKRTKSKTIRSREEGAENDVPSEPKTVVSNFKNRTKRAKPPQRLSFGAGDEVSLSKVHRQELLLIADVGLCRRG
jgi:hypothetical protein